ncbi:hypothetical protein FoTM2_013595 [Fusarium oxysporum f. sp. vasinfectum]|nr:hypothetical protein FoTM2_013595 [Fusarium oxysporum f. sp. vasinfectum]
MELRRCNATSPPLLKVPINYTEAHRLIDWCITHTLTSINLNPRRDQLPYIGDPG